jgi:hypothetical protein
MSNLAHPSPAAPVAGARRWRRWVWATLAVLGLVPVLAALSLDEMNWSAFDFVAFGLMLALAGGCCELAARAAGGSSYRAGAAVAVATAFVMLWAQGAVGLVGEPEHPANLMFAGLLALGAAGALATRGRAAGMARTMLAMALAQALAALAAMLAGWPLPVAASLGFGTLWLVSAGCFHRAARTAHAANAGG